MMLQITLSGYLRGFIALAAVYGMEYGGGRSVILTDGSDAALLPATMLTARVDGASVKTSPTSAGEAGGRLLSDSVSNIIYPIRRLWAMSERE